MAYGERKRPRRPRVAPDAEPSIAEVCDYGAYLSTVGIGPLRKRGAWRFKWSWVKVAIPALVTAGILGWALHSGAWDDLELVGPAALIITGILVRLLPRDGALDLEAMAGRNAVMLTQTHLILRRPKSATIVPRHLVAGVLLEEETRTLGTNNRDDPSLSRSGQVAELVLRFFDGRTAREVMVASAIGDQTVVGFVGKGSAFGHLELFRDALQRWQDGATPQELVAPASAAV